MWKVLVNLGTEDTLQELRHSSQAAYMHPMQENPAVHCTEHILQ